ncbi:MAG: 4-(cytidine 5'-diphospho)-2-C-methyl-D-erythritol kinase [Thermoanaerobaculales bacterium]|nr:4-(cytidine 5'-diphospho)-2-C-methyl-D-erythritol kinase [Thermoanaerobaculales bacterium]
MRRLICRISRIANKIMGVLSVSIPAKVNLHLQVVGRRSDGFHELRTVFQSVDLRDRLTAQVAGAGILDLELEPEAVLPRECDNLVLQAARALWKRVDRSPGVRLRLEKRIPVGGGMGGGSADAAAALVLLDRLWDLQIHPAELLAIASDLGSDVPFFLYGGLAFGMGRGEKILPLDDLEPTAVLILVPSVEISTAEVFSRVSAKGSWAPTEDTVYAGLEEKPPKIDWAALGNDLAGPVCAGWPEVDEALRSLRDLRPLMADVTGSGSAVFAVFSGLEEARAAARELRGKWRVEVVRTLGRTEARPRVEKLK